MKKTLIAMAALAATGAFAQNLTLTGGIDVGVQNATQAIGGSAAQVKNNGTYTSQIDFVGTEDLGGGMSAKLFLELDFNATQSNFTDATSSTNAYYASSPFTGQQYVALAGGFGEVQLGTPNAAALDNNGQIQPFGTALGSGYSSSFGRMAVQGGLGISQYLGGNSASNGGTSGRIIRHEKVVKYITPSFAGFKASLEYSFGYQTKQTTGVNQENANNDQYTALGLSYSKGPLNLVYSYTKDYNPVGGSQWNGTSAAAVSSALLADSSVTYHQLGGNYNFGALTAYAGYTKTVTDNQTAANGLVEDGRSWNVAAKYAVAPAIDLAANYVVRSSSYYNDAKLLGLGADYKLSKRTAVYYRYEAIDTNIDGKTAGTTSSAVITNAVGIRHTF